MCGGVFRLGVVLDDRLALYQYHRQRDEHAAVGYRVPREAKTQHVDEYPEKHYRKVAYHLGDGMSQKMRPYPLLALARRLYSGVKVHEHREQHEYEADEHDHHAVSYVLGHVKMQIHPTPPFSP